VHFPLAGTITLSDDSSSSSVKVILVVRATPARGASRIPAEAENPAGPSTTKVVQKMNYLPTTSRKRKCDDSSEGSETPLKKPALFNKTKARSF
jgi:hypothetical protein